MEFMLQSNAHIDPEYAAKWWAWTKKQAIFAKIWSIEQEFKECKMIYNTLHGLGIYKQCCALWADKVKWEDSAMKHRSVVINMCYFTRVIENHCVASLGRETCGELLLAAMPFFTPLTSEIVEDTVAGSLMAHFVFSQSGKEYELLMDNIKYNLVDTAMHKKMQKLSEESGKKCTDLTDEAEDLKGKARIAQAAADEPRAGKAAKAAAKKAALAAVKAQQKAEASSRPLEVRSWTTTIELKAGQPGLGVGTSGGAPPG